LYEISFQINGPCAILVAPQLASAFRFTPQQEGGVQRLCGQMAEQMHNSLSGPKGGDAAERCMALKAGRQQMKQLLEESNRRIRDLFSEEQKATYAKLTGKPFALSPLSGEGNPVLVRQSLKPDPGIPRKGRDDHDYPRHSLPGRTNPPSVMRSLGYRMTESPFFRPERTSA
jgi:hypothetical protein